MILATEKVITATLKAILGTTKANDSPVFSKFIPMMTFIKLLSFFQACFFFRRLTSESNQGGKFLGVHLILLYHRSTRVNIPRPDQHLCYYCIRLSGAFYHATKPLTYSNVRFYMHHTYTIFRFSTHISNRDKIKCRS